MLDSTDNDYSKEEVASVKLILGKSLYFRHKNCLKFSEASVSREYKSLEKVIQVLGFLVDEDFIDEEGSKILDISMVDYIRETNSLKNCHRCLLCCTKSQLKSSHVIPHFILSGFAKGMNTLASKKVYSLFTGGSEAKTCTPRQMAWWMLCGNCEKLLNGSGESAFAKEFFHEVYKTADPSVVTQEHKIAYSKWLYHFAAGIAFRGLAVNTKGITGFFNDDSVYQIFKACRKILLNPNGNDHIEFPQIGIFTNPLSASPAHHQAVSTLSRLLNMPGFMYLMENDEKVNHIKSPRIANFFIAHLGIINIVVPFGGDFVLPESASISTESGILTVPPESLRLEFLPPALWDSLVLFANKLEEMDVQITEKRLQESKIYDTAPADTLKEAYGIARARQADIDLIKKVGFQPSPDPKFPKKFNLLPPTTCVERSDLAKELSLPSGHKLLLHQTRDESDQSGCGITIFLCASNDYETYVIVHQFLPGLHLDYGFFVSKTDLSPEELLPEENPKFYSQYFLKEQKSSKFIQQSLLEYFQKLNLTLDDLLDAYKR